jgi:hypothetical protein
VINFSISGTRTKFPATRSKWLPVRRGRRRVRRGVGRQHGPTISTVAHPGPWLTTVAAGTHNRNGEGSVTLGNGATYSGASFATPSARRRSSIRRTARPAYVHDPATGIATAALAAELCVPVARFDQGHWQDRALQTRSDRAHRQERAAAEAGASEA